MNAQLLLLMALAGPFCAFTRASPTITPNDPKNLATQTEEAAIFHTTGSPKGYTVITGPPPMQPEPVPQELTTEAVTGAVPTTEAVTGAVLQELTTEAMKGAVPQELATEAVTGAVHQELNTEAVTGAVHQELNTEAVTGAVHQELNTEAATLAAVVTEQTTTETEEAETEPLLRIHASAPETAAPTKKVEVVQTSATAAARTESTRDVLIKEGAAAEGLTSGEAAGTAIGVLLAISFVIAIAITVARRMGKYSP